MTTAILIGAVTWLLILLFAVALCRATARGDRRDARSALSWVDVRVRGGSRRVRRLMALSALRSRRRRLAGR